MTRHIRINITPLLISIIIFFLMEFLIGFSDEPTVFFLRLTVCLIFAKCIYSGLSDDMMLSPYLLFSLTPLSLLLYSEQVSSFYFAKLSHSVWVLGIINMISFLYSYKITKIRKNNFFIAENNKISKKRLKVHAIISSILGRMPTIISIFFGISLPLSSVIELLSYIGIAMAFKSKDKKTILSSILITSLTFIEAFNKTRILFLFMTIFTCIEIYEIKSLKEKIRLITIVIISIVFMVLIAFPLKAYINDGGSFSSFISNFSSISLNQFSYYNDRISFNGPSFLRMPYIYLIQAWNNVQFVIDTQNTRTYGLWMLKPLLGYLQIDTLFDKYYELIPANSFNTFTYITCLYKDFGFYGSVFGSFFLGYYVKKIRLQVCKNGSAFSTASYALVAMATLEMFFSNHFFSLSYPFTIVIIGYLYRFVFKMNGY